MFVDQRVSDCMLMPLLTTWQEMVMIISLNIAQEIITGVLRIQVEGLPFGVKGMPFRTGLLQEVDQECRCQQFPMALMISIALDL